MEAERLFKQALKAGEGCYRRSQQLQHHGTQYEAQHSEYHAGSTTAGSVLYENIQTPSTGLCFDFKTTCVFNKLWDIME